MNQDWISILILVAKGRQKALAQKGARWHLTLGIEEGIDGLLTLGGVGHSWGHIRAL